MQEGADVPVGLVDALREMLSGWQDDLAPEWRRALAGGGLDPGAADPALELEYWEPIFPARRGRTFPGAPPGAHIFRAFDGLAPQDVRCVLLGQDPYPEPGFCTGRAFEAGNVALWRELDKMFSTSVRAFVQMICAARSGNPDHARSFDDWPRLLADIESGELSLEGPAQLADRWVNEGVLLLNAALTLSRFSVVPGAHQRLGHLPVWRPFLVAVLRHLAARGAPLVIVTFGDAAQDCVRDAGLDTAGSNLCVISRAHPADAPSFLGRPNPFEECNRFLTSRGGRTIAW